jgi:tetratricopeptide (TPR) repeat protein
MNKKTLRDVLNEAFSADDLAELCFDIEQDLANAGIKLKVSYEILAGNSTRTKILDLIDYLDNRRLLDYLVRAVRRARPGIVIDLPEPDTDPALQKDIPEANEGFFERLGRRLPLAVLVYQAASAKNAGDFQKARKLYQQCLAISKKSLALGKKSGTREQIITTLMRLAEIAAEEGNYDEAIDMLKQSIEVAEDLGSASIIALCQATLAHMETLRDDQGR